MTQKGSNQKGSSHVAASSGSLSIGSVVNNFYLDYQKHTPRKLKMVDAYLLYILITGVIQFVYCCLVGTFPFNSFLSGFISTVGCFVLGVCIRLQANPQNKQQFNSISPERGFADFIFAHVILHLVIVNFIG
uniref:Dolichyl-diphosphooligosaccharide--protein glycosyltransferase subunit DAD1 n=1 Tax=Hirondellea gigas TaxID=1518452 RepID=A0A6A7FNG0_9CRUS